MSDFPTPEPDPGLQSSASASRSGSEEPPPGWAAGCEPESFFPGLPGFPDLPLGTHISPEEVERELELVHRRALAAVLLDAAAIRVRGARQQGIVATFPVPHPGYRLWRLRAAEALADAQDGDFARSARRMVQALRRSEVGGWPSALRLARLARRIHDGEWARMCVGFACLCEGLPEAAERVFSRLLLRGEVLRRRWCALEGLGLSYVARGRHRLALGAIESAADEPDCAVSTLVESLHLALVVGQSLSAMRGAARLDLLVDSSSPPLAAALAAVRRRRDLGLFDRRIGAMIDGLAKDLARDGSSPSGRVARATIGS